MFKTIDVSDDDFYCITSLINDKKKLVAWNEQGHLQKFKTYNNKISMPCLMSLVFVNITVRSENTNPQWSWKTIWSFHYYHSNLASWWRWKRNSNTCDRVIMPSIFGRNPSTGSIWLPFIGIQQKLTRRMTYIAWSLTFRIWIKSDLQLFPTFNFRIGIFKLWLAWPNILLEMCFHYLNNHSDE